ncbi:MAG: lysophospholipid acyltransferase family protein [Candidatus Kapabacteria bacterium]|nr:lysophospholipid acyltransferase family protein [Candidatus Kapabacteria bacterium]MDW8011631.1 lysophospholipid acyltransferase family protein [Bacteroidota bacterium]
MPIGSGSRRRSAEFSVRQFGTRLVQHGLVSLLRAVGAALRFVPWRWYHSVGWVLGQLWWQASPLRRHVTVENLQRAFPERPRSWHTQVARQCYTNAGIVLAEILSLAWLQAEELEERVRFVNPELFAECAQRGRGLLLLSGHYGNWEWLACAAGLALRRLGIPVTVIVQRQANAVADQWLNRYRTRWGNRTVELDHAAWALARALQKREAVALLADQRAKPETALWLPFFGSAVPVHTMPAAVALRFRVPIILGFAFRQSDGRYVVPLEELPSQDLPDTLEGVRELTWRYLQRLESVIRQHPELWLWQHRRWKYVRPAADVPSTATAP